jgi:hypothetical protein
MTHSVFSSSSSTAFSRDSLNSQLTAHLELWNSTIQVKVTLRLTVSQSVSLSVEPHLGLMVRYLLQSDRSCFCGAPSLTRGRVCLLYMLLVFASAVFLRPSPLVLATIFYCFRFETSHLVASYDSQGYREGIRPRLHTGNSTILN